MLLNYADWNKSDCSLIARYNREHFDHKFASFKPNTEVPMQRKTDEDAVYQQARKDFEHEYASAINNKVFV